MRDVPVAVLDREPHGSVGESPGIEPEAPVDSTSVDNLEGNLRVVVGLDPESPVRGTERILNRLSGDCVGGPVDGEPNGQPPTVETERVLIRRARRNRGALREVVAHGILPSDPDARARHELGCRRQVDGADLRTNEHHQHECEHPSELSHLIPPCPHGGRLSHCLL